MERIKRAFSFALGWRASGLKKTYRVTSGRPSKYVEALRQNGQSGSVNSTTVLGPEPILMALLKSSSEADAGRLVTADTASIRKKIYLMIISISPLRMWFSAYRQDNRAAA